jgi:uncharacterized membrane protein
MRMGLKIFLVTMIFGLMLFSIRPAKSQCAMCSATVESNSKSKGAKTNGLNNGIIYLLSAPYLAIAIVGVIWYKKYRRKDVELHMRDEKLNLN